MIAGLKVKRTNKGYLVRTIYGREKYLYKNSHLYNMVATLYEGNKNG